MTKELTKREKRLAAIEAKVKARLPKHPRWDELRCVIGWINSHGCVDAKIIFQGEQVPTHTELFPNCTRYKLWRWWKCNGVEESVVSLTTMDEDDYNKVIDWLYKHGCLNDWEIE